MKFLRTFLIQSAIALGLVCGLAEQDFGKYDTDARDDDSLAVSLPYSLVIRSAGNGRGGIATDGTFTTNTGGGPFTFIATSVHFTGAIREKQFIRLRFSC